MLKTILKPGLLMALVVGCSSGPSGPLVYVAVPPKELGVYGIQGQRHTFEQRGVAVHLSLVSGPERAQLITALSGQVMDPFGVTKNGQPFFRTFHLKIFNGGPSDIFFNASFVTLKAGGDRFYPKSLPELWSYLIGSVGAESGMQLKGALWDGAVRIAPGRDAEGLLVFAPDSESRPKKLNVEINPLSSAGDPVSLSFGFARREH